MSTTTAQFISIVVYITLIMATISTLYLKNLYTQLNAENAELRDAKEVPNQTLSRIEVPLIEACDFENVSNGAHANGVKVTLDFRLIGLNPHASELRLNASLKQELAQYDWRIVDAEASTRGQALVTGIEINEEEASGDLRFFVKLGEPIPDRIRVQLWIQSSDEKDQKTVLSQDDLIARLRAGDPFGSLLAVTCERVETHE